MENASLTRAPPAEGVAHTPKASLPMLTLGALGVVFGDIGTSPLYTLRECLREAARGGQPSTDDVLGLLSLIFWALTMVVTVKYLTFIMRADNDGEGGIFALLAIVPTKLRTGMGKHRISAVAFVVVIGAALLYGDGAITPAISVLSAIEGLAIAQPSLSRAVVPITCIILIGLFSVQRRGTGTVGAFFGPVMALWFFTIGALGVYHVMRKPAVLFALAPHHAVRYFMVHGMPGFLVLGSVVLAVTGGEALYADMGHFGRRPIRVAWLVLVMPALVLSYFGQGALVLSAPGSVENPFFAMVPKGSATLMLVALSSAATVIASQALISGAFSLTRQALQLGYFPRVTITHTAAHTEGQIYVPQINWVLAIFCLLLVIGFQRSDRLASAYGIAVTGTMALTSVVYYVVTRHTWKWPTAVSAAVLALFLSFDVPFFVANTVKILDGGWVPVLIGIGFIAAMLIWSKGRTLVIEQYAQRFGSIESALPRILEKAAFRVPGTAVFMSSSTKHVPPILAHVVQHMHAVSEHVFLLTVSTETVPAISDEQRIQVIELSGGFYQVVCRYGFMERPNVPEVVREAAARIGVPFDLEATTYFLGRERVLGLDTGSMGRFAEQIYGFMQRNAVPADLHFQIPVSQVIEIGIQLDL